MTARRLIAFAVLVVLALAAQTADAADPPQMPGVGLDEAWTDVTFTHPVLVTHAGDGSGMVYVVERPGKVYRMPKFAGSPQPATKQLFLDMTPKVVGFSNGQGGLMSIAFHPDYKTNRKVYVSSLQALNDPADTENKFSLMIEEYTSDGTRVTRPGRALLAIRKKTPNHQAGHLVFGRDGMLYISVGDDAEPHPSGAYHKSQDMLSPLGKLLRIDVNTRTGRKQYGIPPDNPWPNYPRQVLPEIWAYGLRNPWRFSIDRRGRVWTTEPGTSHKVQAPGKTQEWVTQIVRAGNHGWPFFEGERQLVELPPTIRRETLIPKTFSYTRTGQETTAGIGGYIYEGSRVPGLRGKYVFADFGKGAVYALDLTGSGSNITGSNWKVVLALDSISSLGEDEDRELYVCTAENESWIAVVTAE